jgi:hypothetical protein
MYHDTNILAEQFLRSHREFEQIAALPDNIPLDWVNESWHNDTCPKLMVDGTIIIWFDDEIVPGQLTFCIDTHYFADPDEQFRTPDFDEAIKAVEFIRKRINEGFAAFQAARTRQDGMDSPYGEGQIDAFLYADGGLNIQIDGDAGKYLLAIENMDWYTDSLELLERKLFLYAINCGDYPDLVDWPSHGALTKRVAI